MSDPVDRCDGCAERVTDLDAGFSPGLHEMGHDCGGTWRRVTVEQADALDQLRAAARGEVPIVMASAEREIAYLQEMLATETDPGLRARMQARLHDVLGGRDRLREEPN